ncbi:MAG: hypothetical protein EPN20_00450 [Magnetospirillum sp.]|nr:MAG: hypothetical protein EPN20_00450 [Magnetospirillum sp.]
MSTSLSKTEPRTAALAILASAPPPAAAAAPSPEDTRVTLIRTATAEAVQVSRTLADRLKETENTGSDAARALKIELAKAKLKALRLAAVMAAAARDGKRALGIAKEVQEVARELKGMAGTQAAAAEMPATTAEPTPAGAGLAAKTAAADAPGNPDAPEIKALLAHARATLTIARKAAKPGSEEERRINRILGEVGTPSVATDLAPMADEVHIDLSI